MRKIIFNRIFLNFFPIRILNTSELCTKGIEIALDDVDILFETIFEFCLKGIMLKVLIYKIYFIKALLLESL